MPPPAPSSANGPIPKDEQELVLRASEIVTTLLEWLPEEHEPEDIVYDGIGGMLQVLDPHSSYLDPRSFRHMRARQEGSFFGVGIIISRRNGNVTVISPIAGTPAAARGLRAGDVISGVAGEATEDLTLDEVVDLVRGPEGTTVVLTIARPGFKEPFDVEIERTRIPQTSVRFSFLIEPDIGYIRLSEFSNTSTREVQDAITDSHRQGMKRLIFDLRNNPGGPLDAAVGVSDLFLVRDQLITSTRGRTPENNTTFRAPGNPAGFDGPLVILVNQGSASASEIVAGAVQDHDRGLVLGEVTWGKGLVQTVFTVRDTGLALTTARYYTPSGRCIQRDYESFIDYVTHRNGNDDIDGGDLRNRCRSHGLRRRRHHPRHHRSRTGRFRSPWSGSTASRRSSASRWRSSPMSRRSSTALLPRTSRPTKSSLIGSGPGSSRRRSSNPRSSRACRRTRSRTPMSCRSIKVEVFNATIGLKEGYRTALEGDDQMAAAIEHLDEAADFWDAFAEEHKE